MRADERERPGILLARQQRHGFSRKSRKSGKATEEAGNDQQPHLGRDARVLDEDLDGNTDQIAANQVRCERAEGERRKERVQQDAETPAQPCTERCAEPDCNEACRVHPVPRIRAGGQDARR
ncbi:hypothetical protein D3C83_48590 [compost metagenome]